MQRTLTEGEGFSTVDLLVITSLYQEHFIVKIFFTFDKNNKLP
jgi:hypothetical protein